MSSHHIIRDEQEPALIIAELEPESKSIARQFLEWSPTLIVLENCLSEVVQWGIKIDIAFVNRSNFESVEDLLQDQMPVKILTCKSSEEQLTTALYFLIAGRHRAANMMANEKIDLLKSLQSVSNSLSVGIINSNGKANLFQGKFKKWMAKDSVIKVIRTKGNQTFIIKGVRELEGVFICLSDSFVEIKSNYPFWLSQSL